MKIYAFFTSLAAVILMSVSLASADFTYTITSNNTVTITGHTNPVGDLVIPSSTNGFPVTIIGDDAFKNCSGLTSISVPGSVTIIGNTNQMWGGAFYGCSGLTNVFLGNGITTIGRSAFKGCTSLNSIVIPDSVTRLLSERISGDGPFDGCINLSSVTLGAGITEIPDIAFRGCSSLLSITIPEGVTRIGDEAFRSCLSLSGITFPGSLTSIGSYAFNNCSGLTSVTIPDSVVSIGSSAFVNCPNLTDAVFPSIFDYRVEDIFGDGPISFSYFLHSIADGFHDSTGEYGIATEAYVMAEKIYQPIASSESTSSAITIAPTSSIHHLTITGLSPVSLAWDLSVLELGGQAATWEAWVTVENAGTQLNLPTPVNTASLRVYYLSGNSMPTTSADGETLCSAWRAFKLGTQTNLICNQWMNLPPAP